MFKKLLSNLPFNPSMIDDIPNYHGVLRRERNIRIAGIILLILALMMQLFITLSPSTSSLTTSPNDLVSGGLNSSSAAASYCADNISYQRVLGYFSITCPELEKAQTISLAANAYNNQLLSLNRLAYDEGNESAINIAGQTYWLRSLSAGSAIKSERQKALSIDNNSYFLMLNSGNLVFRSYPSVSSNLCNLTGANACPKLSISARDVSITNSNANGLTISPSDVIIYTLAATNLSKKTINNFAIGTDFSSTLAYARIINGYGGSLVNNVVSWAPNSISPGQTIVDNVSFQVYKPVPITVLSSSDPNYFNLRMVTYYGNYVVIKLPWSFVKFVELKVDNSLPYQNSLISLLIMLLIILLSLYFLLRNMLINKELKCLKNDYLKGYRR